MTLPNHRRPPLNAVQLKDAIETLFRNVAKEGRSLSLASAEAIVSEMVKDARTRHGIDDDDHAKLLAWYKVERKRFKEAAGG